MSRQTQDEKGKKKSKNQKEKRGKEWWENRETGENVGKHWKLKERIRGKHRKTGRIKEKYNKTWENEENVEKHGKTGRIKEKHRKTWENRGKRRKTRENRENQGKT